MNATAPRGDHAAFHHDPGFLFRNIGNVTSLRQPSSSTIESTGRQVKGHLTDRGNRLPAEGIVGIARLTLSERLSVPPESLKLTVLGLPNDVADDPVKLLVSTSDARPVSVLLCSNAAAPELIARAAERIRQARSALPADLAAPILAPVAEGRVEGRSWIMLPYCRPLPRGGLSWWLRRARLRRPILDWLAGVAAATCRAVERDQLGVQVERPLEHLAGLPGVNPTLRQHVSDALARLHQGEWRPRLGLVHNDLWRDNILLPQHDNPLCPVPSAPFYVIDWAGASFDGPPIYDLIRLARSWRLSHRCVRRELLRYYKTPECSLTDGVFDLLLGLARIALNIEQFPIERFTLLADRCHSTLARLLAKELRQANS